MLMLKTGDVFTISDNRPIILLLSDLISQSGKIYNHNNLNQMFSMEVCYYIS